MPKENDPGPLPYVAEQIRDDFPILVVSDLIKWLQAVEMQTRRAAEPSRAVYDPGLEMDLVLFVLALRNLLRAVDLAEKVGLQGVAAARAGFEADVQGVRQVRDILDHFDEYRVGEGWLQGRGKRPPRFEYNVTLERAPGRLVLHVGGGFAVEMYSAAAAARKLVEAIGIAMQVDRKGSERTQASE